MTTIIIGIISAILVTKTLKWLMSFFTGFSTSLKSGWVSIKQIQTYHLFTFFETDPSLQANGWMVVEKISIRFENLKWNRVQKSHCEWVASTLRETEQLPVNALCECNSKGEVNCFSDWNSSGILQLFPLESWCCRLKRSEIKKKTVKNRVLIVFLYDFASFVIWMIWSKFFINSRSRWLWLFQCTFWQATAVIMEHRLLATNGPFMYPLYFFYLSTFISCIKF